MRIEESRLAGRVRPGNHHRQGASRREDVSRRGLLAGGVIGAGALIGCSPSGDRRVPGSGASGASTAGFPVRLEDAYGTVEIIAPSRVVVCAGRTDHDAVLALGITPVALYRFVPVMNNGVGPWAESALGRARPVVLTQPLDYERIATLAPDLILDVQSLKDDKQHATLTAIATTVGLPKGAMPNSVPWQQATEFVATALGRQADGATLVGGVEDLLRDRAAANPSFADQTVAVVLAYGTDIGVYSSSDSRMQLLRGLGFQVAPYVESLGTGKYFTPVSAERLSAVDADVVLVLNQEGDPPADVRRRFPTLDTVSAARAGRMLFVSDFSVSLALSSASVLSIPFAVKSLEPQLRRLIR